MLENAKVPIPVCEEESDVYLEEILAESVKLNALLPVKRIVAAVDAGLLEEIKPRSTGSLRASAGVVIELMLNWTMAGLADAGELAGSGWCRWSGFQPKQHENTWPDDIQDQCIRQLAAVRSAQMTKWQNKHAGRSKTKQGQENNSGADVALVRIEDA